MTEQLSRTSITLPKELKRRARVQATLRDTNLSEVIRELLTKWVEEQDREQPWSAQDRAEAWERHIMSG